MTFFESTPKQRQMLGYMRKLLKMDDDTYYDILQSYNVKSSTQLNYYYAEDLLQRLKAQAASLGLYNPKKSYYDKYSNMAGRYGMGTPKQLRYVNVLWKSVSNQPTDEAKERALNRFIFKITGKERLSFLTQSDISKVIKAIQTMQKKAEAAYAI